jgi:nucleoid-associated protein YgaU
MRKYPYSREPLEFEKYMDMFEGVRLAKSPFRFTVARGGAISEKTWGTSLLVSLEELTTKESADDGDDVIVSFTLKEYKEYGIKILPVQTPTSSTQKTTSTSNQSRSNENKNKKTEKYTVKSGDCLWNIAKAKLGSGAKWKKIYDANKTIIEETAKKRRNGKGSSNGHWIYPGTELIIPNA